jgi:biopolymer transport protein TolR
MGFSTGGPGGMKSDINVTPLVDVVLVLLIIFLVTMPVVMRTVTLEVPRKLEAQEESSTTSKTIIVTYRPDGSVILSEGPGSEDRRYSALELAAKLRPMLEQRSGEKVVFVDFCKGTPWQDVVSTMDRVRSLANDPSDPNHNAIKVALKKKDKKSEVDPLKADPCGG